MHYNLYYQIKTARSKNKAGKIMIFQNLKSIFVLSFLSIKGLLAIENCPKGWINAQNLNMGCLNFNGTKSMAWNDAQDFCHSLNINSHLVEIFSEEQQSFMVLQALLYEGTDHV